MRSRRRRTGFVSFGIPTLLAFVLLLAGCARSAPRPETTPAVAEPTAGAATSDAADEAGTEPSAEPTEEAADAQPADESGAVAEGLDEEEALPGEEVSESPLDELAEVAPELDATVLEQERELVEVAPPPFDIPMVTNDQVLFWLDYYSNRRHAQFREGLIRSGRYLPLFRRIFEEEGVPLDLIFMAHVESAYKTTAYSRARARGIFQFIAATGRRYGLRIDYWVDERLDPEQSARASVAYLKDLHDEFGDWYLALAAYNAGEGRIRRARRRSGHDDFWGIARTRHIRRETKNYVPAILAAVMISKQPEKYGFDFDYAAPVTYETIEVEGAADLQVLAQCAGTDLETMKLLNPALRRYQTPPHATTAVRVPLGAGEVTLAALARVPVGERVLYVRHPVRRGDTLSELARAYGVTVSAIQQANRMGRRTMIRVGEELIVPSVAAGSYPAPAAVARRGGGIPGEPFDYRVRRGDSLSSIAREHGTTASAIAAANGISLHKTLQIDERLVVVPGVRSSAEARRIAEDGPTSASEQGRAVHTVRRGESLSVIARRYGTTPEAIAAANGISVHKLLQIGERLIVTPAGGATVVQHTPAVVHTVRRGDSLWRIARRYSTTVDVLCELNRILPDATLYPGTRLTVRID